MALFDDAIVQAITAQVQRHYYELGEALAEPSERPTSGQENAGPSGEGSLLQGELALLVRVANGEYARTAAARAQVQRVEMALQHVLDLLLGNALRFNATIPNEFWQTETGILISRVRWWISVDDLITISNAAALAFGENTQANRMRIARAMESGQLEWVPDPSVVNPQQNRRVLRPQVERLRDQRQLPE